MTNESADFLFCDEVLEYESSDISSDQSNSAVDSAKPAPVKKKIKKPKVYISKKKIKMTPPSTPPPDSIPALIAYSPPSCSAPFNVDDFFA